MGNTLPWHHPLPDTRPGVPPIIFRPYVLVPKKEGAIDPINPRGELALAMLALPQGEN